MPKFVFLATDLALYAQLLMLALYVVHAWRTPLLRQTWRYVQRDATAMACSVILGLFMLIAVLDSVHFRPILPALPDANAGAAPAYSMQTLSVLDAVLSGQRQAREKTYSRPMATHQFSKESLQRDGVTVRDYPRLHLGGRHLQDPAAQWAADLIALTARGLAWGALTSLIAIVLLVWALGQRHTLAFGEAVLAAWRGKLGVPWRAIALTVTALILTASWVATVWPHYHVLGTDQTGNDVLYACLKSIRTAVVIGSLATIATLPLALVFGILAGYFKGWVDDAIQYFYTVLSSIPSVLLISAFVLMIQVFIDKNPELFETGLERADIRLFLLAMILGITGWAQLARLLRAETLKLSELDYVQAARAFGVSDTSIIRRHILPNLTHIVVIVGVLDFSGLVLYEAVLSYVGVGVDPNTNSFGSMINTARHEMSQDPLVWWNLVSAFGFMLVLVLAMTLFAGAVREAFDPRARAYRVRTGAQIAAPLKEAA